jgi:hypothetical protein
MLKLEQCFPGAEVTAGPLLAGMKNQSRHVTFQSKIYVKVTHTPENCSFSLLLGNLP